MTIFCIEESEIIKDFSSFYEHKEQTLRIMEMVKPYFLAPYADAPWQREKRTIGGEVYVVERPNHALAHGLRQGFLAKDIFNLLLSHPIEDSSGIVEWANRKKTDPLIMQKIQMAASFQRTGRESECGCSDDFERYKKYELQDLVNFKQHAQECNWFVDEEREIFAEAILWSNPGTLDEHKIEDLKYLRRIFHAAHTLDLRRMKNFNGEKIQKNAIDQLFGWEVPLKIDSFQRLLWDRSGAYLQATGDRDLVDQRGYQDEFFIQTRNPLLMVDAIDGIFSKALVIPNPVNNVIFERVKASKI